MTIEDIKELRAHYESNDAISKICDYLISEKEAESEIVNEEDFTPDSD